MEPASMENKETRRKSSILKPQKTRKPFGDVDLGNEDSGDATNVNKTDRRVSFASNNYVKPFAADPEKNTIWDTTYEEAIQGSGSPQSRDVASELNTTLSAIMCSEYKDDSVCDEIEFTAPVNGQCADSEDVKDSKPMEMDVSDMDLTEINIETINDTRTTGVEMEFSTILTETVETNNLMELTEVEMEFTTPINIIFPSENKSDLNHLDMALDLTRDDTVKPSDFSKVINGDLFPSFSNLPRMPLRGINSTSFVQSLTKEELEDISLLCDTSVALISDGSLSNDNIKINNPADAENESVDALCIFDNMEMLEMQKVYQLEAETLCLEKSIKEATPKICKQLEETNLFYLKQLETYSKVKHILDEFFNTREKQENTKATKDRILKLCEGNEDYWSIKSLDGNIFEFSTLYGTIELSVQLNEEDGYVLDIELRDCINREKSEQIALYTHKIFIEKLQLKQIQSALGNKFEIFSLLDYVRLTMEKLVEVEQEFSLLEMLYGLSMDPEFKITFALISIKCMFTWIFTIDVADYEHVDRDKVSYNAKIGDLRESDIKKCLNACPTGFSFVKAFIDALYNFLENIEKK